MEHPIDYINYIGNHALEIYNVSFAVASKLGIGKYFTAIVTFVGTARLYNKPICSFWNNKVAPLVTIRPTEKLMANPIYVAVAYVVDWTLSIKLPRVQK